MAAAVFCPLSRQRPGLLIEIEFAPGRVRQLIAPLSRQQQQLAERAERPADAIAGERCGGPATGPGTT